ncbi:MAG: 30S ribosomal protein S6 [Clostridia bacterium]|nr:30S ribosomal protein S6 [Clostridia bacterium]
MIKYELVIIVRPDLSDKEVNSVDNDMQDKIKLYAKITKSECIGKKKMAYEIKKFKEGYYFVYDFEVEENKTQEAISETERYCRITDDIIKFITIKQD